MQAAIPRTSSTASTYYVLLPGGGTRFDLIIPEESAAGHAAKEAGLDRKTIERMIKRHGLRGLY